MWSIEAGERIEPFVGLWARGSGKALAVDTPIPTPSGWTTMGAIRPGDTVFDHLGQPTCVVAVSGISIQPSERVVFANGATLVASLEHRWAVLDRDARRALPTLVDWAVDEWPDRHTPCAIEGCAASARRGALCSAHAERRRTGRPLNDPLRARVDRGQVRRRAWITTTATLRDTQLTCGPDGKREHLYAIPVAGPLACTPVDLPLDPYVLGAWLGDGTTAQPIITAGGEDRDAMVHLLEERVECKVVDRPNGVVSIRIDARPALMALGVLGNKHIPAAYLRASEPQRRDLLRGLLDTDGSAAGGRAAEFGTNRRILADGVAELARSLGYRVTVTETRARLYGKDCGPFWRLLIGGIEPGVFGLKRKADLVRERAQRAHPWSGRLHSLERLETAFPQPVQCITVASPAGMFLAGEAMIPTHNSTLAEVAISALAARRRRVYALYVSGTVDLAVKHVENIGELLESEPFASMYPEVGTPKRGKFGNQTSWRDNRLTTDSGFTIDAVGLNQSIRGAKVGDARPDIIVLDDLDDATDSPKVTKSKLTRLTRSVLPTGARHCVILGLQNLVIPNGVFARIAGIARDVESGDLLTTAKISGPIPAVRDLQLEQQVDEQDEARRTRWVAVGGTPTWQGQDLQRVTEQISEWGKTTFLVEAQHDVHLRSGGVFRAFEWMARNRPDGTPLMVPAPFPADDPQVIRIRMWDTAATEPTGDNDPDWTVGVLMAVHLTRKVYRIEDVVRFRGAAGTVKNRIRQTAIADHARYGGRITVGVEQEPGPHGRDRAYAWVHDTLAGFNAKKIPASSSKPERAEGLAGAMENMLVEIVERDWDGQPTWDAWVKDFLAELEAFTVEDTHDHDDQVDAGAHAFNWLQGRLIHGKPTTTSAAQMDGARL